MSNIKDKVFDASQKILRAVFHGAPNLFTAPDINRQLAAFDYRFQQKEAYLPVVAKLVYTIGTRLEIKYSYIELAGAVLYDGPQVTVELDTTAEDFFYGVGIWVKKSLVTYDTDNADHLISGAVFDDGTSQSAADHYVISDWGFCYGDWTDLDAHTWYGVPENAEVIAVPVISTSYEKGGYELVPNFLRPGLPILAYTQKNTIDASKIVYQQAKYNVSVTLATDSASFNGVLGVRVNQHGVTFNITGSVSWTPSVNSGRNFVFEITRTGALDSSYISEARWTDIIQWMTAISGQSNIVLAGAYSEWSNNEIEKGEITVSVYCSAGKLYLEVGQLIIGDLSHIITGKAHEVPIYAQLVQLATR